MKTLALIYCLVASLVMTSQTTADNKQDLQNAVTFALNGTLNDDHIGPDERRRLESVILANATQANSIALNAIEQANGKGRLAGLYVTNVAKLTAESDKQGASRVLRRYIALLDATISRERTKSTKENPDDEADRRRSQKLREARSQAKALEITL